MNNFFSGKPLQTIATRDTGLPFGYFDSGLNRSDCLRIAVYAVATTVLIVLVLAAQG